MANTMDFTKERFDGLQSEVEIPELEASCSRLGLTAILVMAAFVGLWGTVCLVSGLSSCDGVGSAGRSLFTALTGM